MPETKNEPTPGPWAPMFDDAITVHGPDGSRICSLANTMGAFGMHRRPPNEVEANARLIAAAPETKRQRDALLDAADHLCNEVYGWLSVYEQEMRRAVGSTNYAVMKDRADHMKATIDKYEQSDA
jgi:hypothetical protein